MLISVYLIIVLPLLKYILLYKYYFSIVYTIYEYYIYAHLRTRVIRQNKTFLACLILELYLEVVLKELLAVYFLSKQVVATKFFLKSRIASLTEHVKAKELVGILDKRRNLAVWMFI